MQAVDIAETVECFLFAGVVAGLAGAGECFVEAVDGRAWSAPHAVEAAKAHQGFSFADAVADAAGAGECFVEAVLCLPVLVAQNMEIPEMDPETGLQKIDPKTGHPVVLPLLKEVKARSQLSLD